MGFTSNDYTNTLTIPIINVLDENGMLLNNNSNGDYNSTNETAVDNEILHNDQVIEKPGDNVPIDNTPLSVFKQEIQKLYAYINKICSDLNAKIDNVSTEVSSVETVLKDEIDAVKQVHIYVTITMFDYRGRH